MDAHIPLIYILPDFKQSCVDTYFVWFFSRENNFYFTQCFWQRWLLQHRMRWQKPLLVPNYCVYVKGCLGDTVRFLLVLNKMQLSWIKLYYSQNERNYFKSQNSLDVNKNGQRLCLVSRHKPSANLPWSDSLFLSADLLPALVDDWGALHGHRVFTPSKDVYNDLPGFLLGHCS